MARLKYKVYKGHPIISMLSPFIQLFGNILSSVGIILIIYSIVESDFDILIAGAVSFILGFGGLTLFHLVATKITVKAAEEERLHIVFLECQRKIISENLEPKLKASAKEAIKLYEECPSDEMYFYLSDLNPQFVQAWVEKAKNGI
ncbi:MAG: hypothetical protein IJY09_10400 [Lachnospiraceae bacterium]|nr:hypothetical protein [Lachnospiraceae bacterium]